jgi:hypothetical protein
MITFNYRLFFSVQIDQLQQQNFLKLAVSWNYVPRAQAMPKSLEVCKVTLLEWKKRKKEFCLKYEFFLVS